MPNNGKHTTFAALVVLTTLAAALAIGGCPTVDLSGLVSGLSFGSLTGTGGSDSSNDAGTGGGPSTMTSNTTTTTTSSDTTTGSGSGDINPISEPDSGGTTSGGDSGGGTIDSNPPDPGATAIKTAFTIDPAGLSGAYLMAFLACEGDPNQCGNPMNHRVYLASSDDGVHWSVPADWQPYQGSVPDVVERGDKIYIYTPNQVVIIDETSGEVSEPVDVQIDTDLLPAGFVDPSPALDENGRIVLFFIPGSFEAIGTCSGGATSCTIPVYSATETDAMDGIHFKLDDGVRAEVGVDTTGGFRSATDPDIFFDGTQWVLYVSHGASMSLWTSSSLRGSYTQSTSLTGGLITHGTGGVGAGVFDDTGGQYWTFAHINDGSGNTVIRRAAHSSLTSQLSSGDFATVLSASDLGFSGSVASPGVWKRR